MKRIVFIVDEVNNDNKLSMIDTINKLSKYRLLSLIILTHEIELDISSKIELYHLDYNINDLKKNKKEIIDKISSLTTKNDILIYMSNDISYLIPKQRMTILEYYKSSKSFLSFKQKRINKGFDYFIFFDNIERNKIIKKYKGSFLVYPSNRYYPKFDVNQKNNIIFINNEYEDPMKALKFISMLNNKNIHFIMYGIKYEGKIKDYILENSLEKIVELKYEYDKLDAYKNADILFVTDMINIKPVSAIEALSQSLVILTYRKIDDISEKSSIIIDNKNINEAINEIKDLYIKNKKLEKYKTQAFNESLKYSNEVIIAKWLDILSILDNSTYKQ